MVKYASNAYHALKVAFGNEIATVCQQTDVDAEAVDERLLQRHQAQHLARNISCPGFAFGGSCLPKDVRAILHAAQRA